MITAIDLGSNTLRVINYDCESNQKLSEYEKIVGTARGLTSTNTILDKNISLIIDALNEAKEKIGISPHYRAVTTQAMRVATNAKHVQRRIKEETGIYFEIITGEEEARLTTHAVTHRLDLLGYQQSNRVIIDIGGGSTEIIFINNDQLISKSFDLGIVTFSETYDYEPIKAFVAQHKADLFVATAGTPTTIAALKVGLDYATYDPDKINGVTLTPNELHHHQELLISYDEERREKLVGTNRGDLIIAGITIFTTLFDLLNQKECIVIDDGLREGVAIDLCQSTES